jgi:G6PDH family F420-dependent oxidoreductase
VAVGGDEAAALAAKAGDGMIATEPKAELVKAYHDAGGRGPVYGQVALCFDDDDDRALQTATERWRFAVGGWPVQSELPRPSNFDAATAHVRPEDMASLVGHGPDPGVHAAAVGQFVEAGFTHVAVVQIGPEQDRFLRFWQDQLRPRLGS